MGFHPANFGLRSPFLSRVRSRHATDRRTDTAVHCVPFPTGRGVIKSKWSRVARLVASARGTNSNSVGLSQHPPHTHTHCIHYLLTPEDHALQFHQLMQINCQHGNCKLQQTTHDGQVLSEAPSTERMVRPLSLPLLHWTINWHNKT